ncbi:winged helix-turn-helix domain-containing protein [Paenibacillus sp. OAS669]|uniref:winged helix-turn-helix domain-containing protein n=1 Tax=Paenibacillus sp. OAS669 TaxID=2663821 RepID=UPI0019DD8F9E|nr:helix-turn-helix domain-containing protein [Paenibacillus sp. OAS669]MBE1446629.1 DNA-binding transcriptional ArsR family regulator [Paenibacillus sp. OAS669]
MQQQDIMESCLIQSPDQAMALLNPLRADIVSRLIEPASAAELARMINEPPQRMNYHLKALEKTGLIRRVGTRQVRNLVEVLYQSIAKTFVLAESLSLSEETIERLKEHGSLAQLITTAEQMKKDAVYLMEHSEKGIEIPSATLQMDVPLLDGEDRETFIADYVDMVKQLVGKYAKAADNVQSPPLYKVILSVYPKAAEGEPSK